MPYLNRLLSLHPKIIDLSLERMERILERLGNPEENLPPVIHVAGTNGKGSTVAYLRSILEAGRLSRSIAIPRRISSNSTSAFTWPVKLIAEDKLSALLEECERPMRDAAITFFEITTAAAFLAFARTPADYLLLEVGLGGRLDATNVIANPSRPSSPRSTMTISNISGNTLTAIAHEKAGILKHGVPAIIGAAARRGAGRDRTRRRTDRRAALHRQSGLAGL